MSKRHRTITRRRKRQSQTNWGRIAVVLSAIAAVATILGFAFEVPQRLGLTRRPFKPAGKDEVLVIVTDFTGDKSTEADTRIYRALSERVAESGLANVRVERLEGDAPLVTNDAVAIGDEFGATLVIWGTADGHGIEPRYEITRNEELIVERADLGVTIATDVPTFSAYVVEGVPNEFEYLMLFSVGQIAFESADWWKALSALSEALEVDLGNRASDLGIAIVYLYRSGAYFFLNDFQSALEDLDQAIRIDTRYALAHNNRAHIHYLQGNLHVALAGVNYAIEVDPDFVPAYFGRGLIYDDMGLSAAAIENFEQVLILDPDYVDAEYARHRIAELEG